MGRKPQTPVVPSPLPWRGVPEVSKLTPPVASRLDRHGPFRRQGPRYEAITRSGFYRMTCPQRRLWCVAAWWVLFWRALPGGV